MRIHQQSPGVWLGSRLAVDAAYRRQGQLGPTLIRLAVCSAHALGCEAFLCPGPASERTAISPHALANPGGLELRGVSNARMQADLAFYPPCDDPRSGMVIPTSRPPRTADAAAFLTGGAYESEPAADRAAALAASRISATSSRWRELRDARPNPSPNGDDCALIRRRLQAAGDRGIYQPLCGRRPVVCRLVRGDGQPERGYRRDGRASAGGGQRAVMMAQRTRRRFRGWLRPRAYQVLIGGHTNLRSDRSQLAVAVLGETASPLSSSAAQAGQTPWSPSTCRGGGTRRK